MSRRDVRLASSRLLKRRSSSQNDQSVLACLGLEDRKNKNKHGGRVSVSHTWRLAPGRRAGGAGWPADISAGGRKRRWRANLCPFSGWALVNKVVSEGNSVPPAGPKALDHWLRLKPAQLAPFLTGTNMLSCCSELSH